jgi:hypothetical protein
VGSKDGLSQLGTKKRFVAGVMIYEKM